MELALILPKIEEASKALKIKHESNPKKFQNAIKKMKEVIKSTKLDICTRHQDANLGLVFNSCKQFDNFVTA